MGIKDVVKDNWTAANTSSITPAFSTGWYDVKNVSPQITFTDPEEAAQSSGPTGYFGMANGTPSQYWIGSIDVNIWVTREDTAVNPKKLVHEFKEEVKRLIRAKYDDVTGLDFIVWRGGHSTVETDKSPVVYRYAGEVGYGYMTT